MSKVNIIVRPLSSVYCDMCDRCAKELEEHYENPYNLISPMGTLNLDIVKELVKENIFLETFDSGTSVLYDDYYLNFDCRGVNCEVGFALEVNVELTFNTVRWFL